MPLDSLSNYRRRGTLAAAIGSAYGIYRQNGGNITQDAAAVGNALGNYWNNLKRSRFGSSAPTRARNLRRRVNPGRTRFRTPSSGSYGGKTGYKRRFKRRVRGKRFRVRRRFSGVSHKGMLSKLWKEMHCPQVLKVTTARTVVSAGIGLRSWHAVLMNTGDDLSNALYRAPSASFFHFTSPGVATTQAPYGSCKSLHFNGGFYKIQVQNRDNWNMHLKIYDCMYRRDCSSVVITGVEFFNQGTTGADLTSVDRDYGQPQYAGTPDLLTDVYQNPSYTPYMSSPFCSKFKILKCTSMVLGPNDYKFVTYRIPRRKIDLDYMNNRYVDSSNSNHYAVGGWTRMLLFSWVGGPVDTGHQADHKQSKSKNTLSLQIEEEHRFFFERRTDLLYNIASSNAGSHHVGSNNVNYYKTDDTVMYVPATETVQTVAATPAPSGHDPADLVVEEADL